MSWLSDLADWAGSAFSGGSSYDPNDTASVMDAYRKGTLFGSPSSFSGTGLQASDLLKYGMPLVGTYFEQSLGKSNAESYAQQAAAQIAAEKEMLDKKLAADLEGARISAGASVASANIAAGAAKKNTLANLYANWADLTNKTGQQKAEQASRTGQNMNEGAVARAKVLI
jgi:hypothetical protein